MKIVTTNQKTSGHNDFSNGEMRYMFCCFAQSNHNGLSSARRYLQLFQIEGNRITNFLQLLWRDRVFFHPKSLLSVVQILHILNESPCILY